MKKNNLEKLYQDKFKDFREIPDEQVWESISASLDKKKKKRVIPIWWKVGGVAAILALLFFAINPFENKIRLDQTTDVETPVNQKPSSTEDAQNKVNDLSPTNDNSNSIKVAETNTQEKEDHSIKRLVTDKKLNSENNVIATTTDAKDKITKGTGIKSLSKNLKNKKQIANNSVILEKENTKNSKDNLDFKYVATEAEDNKVASTETNNLKEKDISSKQKQAFENEISESEKAIVDVNTEDNKKSIFDVIEEQKKGKAIAKVETAQSKWSIGPSVAPIYFDAMGEGSPIHSTFVENSKSGNINLSYGLSVGYSLGKRLKLRSGIHMVDYGYDTNEVVISSSVVASSEAIIENIDFSQTSKTIVLESRKTNNVSQSNIAATDFSGQSPERDGRLSQQIGYLEVPVELDYALVDKKVGVNIIGGFSSLFLIDNVLSLESEGLVTEVGEANNLNSVNFSGNLGLGFSYQFSQKVQINLEPVFKYQLNTFSETAGNFNPYSVGVYSGLQFRF